MPDIQINICKDYSIVLVEFEKANTSYCLSSENMESESVRKGLTQIKDWQRWMSKNQDYFLRNIGLTQKGIDIPIYRIYYYLVVSRRDYMDDLAHDIRSQTKVLFFYHKRRNEMSYKLVIVEKPSVAQSIAKVIGADQKAV